MSQAASRPSAHALPTAAVALLLAGISGPSPAHDDRITLRVNDAEGTPGGLVDVVVRSYAPRAIGQGQLCLRGGSSESASFSVNARASHGAPAAAEAVGEPFAALEQVLVFSELDDAEVWAVLQNQDSAMVEFVSPSAGINTSDGDIALLRLRLAPTLLPDQELTLELEPANTFVMDPQGSPIPLETKAGRLRIRAQKQLKIETGGIEFGQRTFVTAEEAGVAVITVKRPQGMGEGSVAYSTLDRSAVFGEDYVGVSGSLTWAPGGPAIQSFTVPIVDDGRGEANETLDLILSHPTGDATLDRERSTAVLTILGNDGGPGAPAPGAHAGLIRFTEREFQVVEDNEWAWVRVERINGSEGVVSVSYETSDGSATAGEDFAPSSSTLIWAHGETGAKSFRVPIFEDARDEGSETLNLTLTDPKGGAILDARGSTALMTLLDNDNPVGACVADRSTLCLLNGRFQVEAVWHTARGQAGAAQAKPMGDGWGLFWFFASDNMEMLVKVLDACSLADFRSFWVLTAATTNVGFTVRVTDTVSGLAKEYSNPLGEKAESVQDTVTFRACADPAKEQGP